MKGRGWRFPCPVSCGGHIYWVVDEDEMAKLLAALERGKYDTYLHWCDRANASIRLNAREMVTR